MREQSAIASAERGSCSAVQCSKFVRVGGGELQIEKMHVHLISCFISGVALSPTKLCLFGSELKAIRDNVLRACLTIVEDGLHAPELV